MGQRSLSQPKSAATSLNYTSRPSSSSPVGFKRFGWFKGIEWTVGSRFWTVYIGSAFFNFIILYSAVLGHDSYILVRLSV